MITQEQLDADKAAIEAAQAKLAADQAEFDRTQPHLSVLAEIEQAAYAATDDVRNAILALVSKAKSLL